MKKNDSKKNNSKVISQIRAAMQDHATVPLDRAKTFFKTGHGEYACNDQFIGVAVPNLRKIAKEFNNLMLEDISYLLESKINEERLLALIILVMQYKSADHLNKKKLYHFYLNNINYVNNWNLVDASSHLIIGAYLWENSEERPLLIELTQSDIMWRRRIAIVSTWYFIKHNDLEWTFKIAQTLLGDKHDLIHKAVGWMLRESGKRDQEKLIAFLNRYGRIMPRTSLRYAIEKFSENLRQHYLKKW